MEIGDHVLFKGYSHNPAGYKPVLRPGDTCVVEMIDGEAALRVRAVPSRPTGTIREWVFVEEVVPTSACEASEGPHPDLRRVLKMMACANTKAFTDLRDRVAYMFVTGAHPTHMRPFFTGALNVLSTCTNPSGRFGPHLVDSSAVHELDVNSHPLVVEARRLVSDGWRLVVSLGSNARRPYSQLYFAREQHRLTLHAEGWTRPRWPQDWPRRSVRRMTQVVDDSCLCSVDP